MSRQLFGGAIVCDIPARFVDVSQFREVPDNQEVLGDPSSDQSVIVELLEPLPTQGQGIILEHYDEIASSNEATEKTIVRVGPSAQNDLPHFAQNIEKYELYGTQSVSKHREQAKNVVNIYLCVIRLPAPIDTDIIITLNDPVRLSPESSASRYADNNHPSADDTMALWRQILRSFHIRDYGLFGQ